MEPSDYQAALIKLRPAGWKKTVIFFGWPIRFFVDCCFASRGYCQPMKWLTIAQSISLRCRHTQHAVATDSLSLDRNHSVFAHRDNILVFKLILVLVFIQFTVLIKNIIQFLAASTYLRVEPMVQLSSVVRPSVRNRFIVAKRWVVR